MKKLLAMLLAATMVISMVGCTSEPAPAPEDTSTPADTTSTPADTGADEEYEIAVLIKATDSSFWNKVGAGASAYGEEFPNVKVSVQGPASEADVEESLSLLENVILSAPDAIVLGSNADAGTTAVIAEATAAGIPVVTIDTSLPSGDIVCHLATDNVLGGALAAEAMVKYMTDNGIALEGKVAIVAAVAGVQTIIDRDNGFIDKMAEIAPDIEVLEPIYVENEIETSMSTAENLFITHGDELIGIYADNGHTGDGVARAVEQAGLQDSITVVAFDDDDEEIEALKNDVIKTLIIQNQHNMGYSGVEYALKAIQGTLDTDFVDTGVMVTWADDLA